MTAVTVAREAPRWDGPAPVVAGTLVVLAPHPDDEVLGCGGLLRWAVGRGHPVRLVAVTDGEASHARSARVTPSELATIRRAERGVALHRLGVASAVRVERLCLPDGAVAAHEDELVARLRPLVGAGDVVVAPRDDDGHPDHDATGRAAARLVALTGAERWSVAVWAKVRHPDPGAGARLLHLDPASRAAKVAAVDAYRSQLVPLGPSRDDGPVVHPHELEAMLAGPEVVAL